VLASAQQRGAGHERGLLDETTVALAHRAHTYRQK
jgi:hypothetical protein